MVERRCRCCVLVALPAYAAPERVVTVDVARAQGPVDRFFDLSVGSDYPGTLIRDDSQAQLKTAADELGFRYLRFHAIFHDVLGTVQVEDGQTVYDWTGIDQLYDDLLARHIRPFVELGFTPEGARHVAEQHLLLEGQHLAPASRRRGATWSMPSFATSRSATARTRCAAGTSRCGTSPISPASGRGADQQAYFELYDLTARTHQVDRSGFAGRRSCDRRSGLGSRVSGARRTRAASPVDFVTTHTYGVDGGFLDENGKSDTKLSPSPDAIVGDVRRVRQQIAASAFPELPLYFTEWSTSYTPRDSVHDSYISAPYILTKLKASQGLAQGMSYWTY